MKWIAFLFSVATVFATAQTIDFRGVPMGAKEKQLLEKAPFLKCQDTRPDDNALGDRNCYAYFHKDNAPENARFGGIYVSYYSAYFYGDKLSDISIHFDVKNFNAVLDVMIEKFGKNATIDAPIYKPERGHERVNATVVWNRADSSVEIEKYGADIYTSRVSYHYKPLQGEYEKRAKELTKKRAKTL